MSRLSLSASAFLRGVRALGLRTLALTLAALTLLNLAILAAATYLETGRNGSLGVIAPPVMAQAIAAANLLDRLDTDARADALGAISSPILHLKILDDFEKAPPIRDPRPVFVPVIEAFRQLVDGRRFTVYLRSESSLVWPLSDTTASIFDRLVIVLRLEDGKALLVEGGDTYGQRIFEQTVAYVIGVVGLILVGLVVWASVSYAQPLARLAAASRRFSRDLDAAPMREIGPKPVRDLAASLNNMQARLRDLVSDRTTALAAIAHDMRTYLTRLRMRAEFIEDPAQQARAVQDLEDMTRLLEASLALGEAHAQPAKLERLNLAIFLPDFVARRQEAAPEADITLALELEPANEAALVETDISALARVLNNLVENALRYGGSAALELARENGGLCISVLDDGPGVPEEHLKAIIKPYARLETSRSRETGGAGLGLAIAVASAKRAGAELDLANRPMGGLAARILFAAPES